ncbi:hypothetical protein [Microbispora sp. NBRC 16548]|nr:hypothetical protein [Microbispora sp. NBRC 16548]GLX04722.1 hypothetical protein Misp03_16490 [Microbispora sp. NBRC 16548]
MFTGAVAHRSEQDRNVLGRPPARFADECLTTGFTGATGVTTPTVT